MFLTQLLRIAWALLRLMIAALRERWGVASHGSRLPRQLRDTLANGIRSSGRR